MATYTGDRRFRSGDFSTIRQFAEAYIDRGIVFYRMREFDRAFADIAQAKRHRNANRARATLPGCVKTNARTGVADRVKSGVDRSRACCRP